MRREWADPWEGLRRVQRGQKRLADGSLGGATNLASPVTPNGASMSVPTVVTPGSLPLSHYVIQGTDDSQSITTTADLLVFDTIVKHYGQDDINDSPFVGADPGNWGLAPGFYAFAAGIRTSVLGDAKIRLSMEAEVTLDSGASNPIVEQAVEVVGDGIPGLSVALPMVVVDAPEYRYVAIYAGVDVMTGSVIVDLTEARCFLTITRWA